MQTRAFKKETGFSIIEYINKLKIKHATFLLRDTALPIQDIGRIIGINDVNYFSRLFKRYMSQTPTQYRKIFN
ncbi:helix-turn-helix transcriptional regulator [Intestinibacter bartlettii]|uniref:helix-turn-helix transcriptional regulator n=1 Tax=Intestinibacter bartlettii TaxID=261299 RepID=UPI003AB4A02C